MRKIAEQIPLSPTITLRDGLLLCTIYCPGAITVHETMIAGESLFFEPNQDVTYKVSAYWDGATFVSYRNCPAVYGGKRITQRRWVDEHGRLVMRTDWSDEAKPFIQICERSKS